MTIFVHGTASFSNLSVRVWYITEQVSTHSCHVANHCNNETTVRVVASKKSLTMHLLLWR